MNHELAQRVADYIAAHPEEYDQTTWHYCSAGCVAFHAVRLAYPDAVARGERDGWAKVGQEALELVDADANWLFDGDRTKAQVIRFLTASECEFDEDGYDSAGRDRRGYDEDGYDEDGYDEDGRAIVQHSRWEWTK